MLAAKLIQLNIYPVSISVGKRNNALAESEVYIYVKPVNGVHARAIQMLKYWVHFGMI
jgi:hypothetical protein